MQDDTTDRYGRPTENSKGETYGPGGVPSGCEQTRETFLKLRQAMVAIQESADKIAVDDPAIAKVNEAFLLLCDVAYPDHDDASRHADTTNQGNGSDDSMGEAV